MFCFSVGGLASAGLCVPHFILLWLEEFPGLLPDLPSSITGTPGSITSQKQPYSSRSKQERKVRGKGTPREAEMEHQFSSALAPRFSVSSAANCLRKMRIRRISPLCWHSRDGHGSPAANCWISAPLGTLRLVLKALLTFTDPKPGARVHFSSLLLVKLLGKEGALGMWGWLGLISGTQGGR